MPQYAYEAARIDQDTPWADGVTLPFSRVQPVPGRCEVTRCLRSIRIDVRSEGALSGRDASWMTLSARRLV